MGELCPPNHEVFPMPLINIYLLLLLLPSLLFSSLHSPEEVIKKLEKRVNALIEESAHARALGDYQTVSHCVCV